jgi:hypothetical protein
MLNARQNLFPALGLAAILLAVGVAARTFQTKHKPPISLSAMITPSYSEYLGLYNAVAGTSRTGIISTEDDRTSLQTAPFLPHRSWQEVEDVRSRLSSVLADSARRANIKPASANVWYKDHIDPSPDDRTIFLDMPRPEMLTPDFAEAIQNVLSTHHPFWRVLVRGEKPETVVTIYNTAVRCCDDFASDNWKIALANAVALDQRLRELRVAPQLFQADHAIEAIASNIDLMKGGHIVPLLRFDTWNGDARYHTLWLGYTGRSTEGWFDVQIRSPDSVAVGDSIAIDESGSKSPEYIYDPDNPPSYWIKQFIIPVPINRVEFGRVYPGRGAIDEHPFFVELSKVATH